jgi:hypothetical protein
MRSSSMGVGSLDSEGDAGTLEQVLQTLQDLVGRSRAIGLISHAPLVQQAVPNGFWINSTESGSLRHACNNVRCIRFPGTAAGQLSCSPTGIGTPLVRSVRPPMTTLVAKSARNKRLRRGMSVKGSVRLGYHREALAGSSSNSLADRSVLSRFRRGRPPTPFCRSSREVRS